MSIITSSRPDGPTTEQSPRILWMARVRPGDFFGTSRGGDRVEWHIAGCPGEHCREGARRLAEGNQPDGHCIVRGLCSLCDTTA